MSMINEPLNSDALFSISWDAAELVELLHENKLQGKLKKIAGTLDEEDNPVIMLMRQKAN